MLLLAVLTKIGKSPFCIVDKMAYLVDSRAKMEDFLTVFFPPATKTGCVG